MNIQTKLPSGPKLHAWVKGIILTGAFIFSYYSTIMLLVRTWLGRDNYSHGFLVPFIGLYLAWSKRDELARAPLTPAILSGLFITIVAGILLLAGHVGSVAILQELSLLIVLPGLVLMVLGRKNLKILALPLTYLVFMVPILDPLLDGIRWPLQLITAKFAGILLNIIGIENYQHAQFIELSHITLEVADICSGASYLITLYAIAIPLAFLTQRDMLRRTILLVLTLFIVIANNIVRVTVIGIWTTHHVGADVHGPHHVMQGFVVAVVGYVLLFILAWALARQPLKKDANPATPQIMPDYAHHYDPKVHRAWLIAALILISFGSYLNLYSSKGVPLKADLKDFPATVGGWELVNESGSLDVLNILPTDATIKRTYRDQAGSEVTLHIGYFEVQQQDKEMINYKMQKFYRNAEKAPIPGMRNFIANKTTLDERDNPAKHLVLYWYDLNGRIVANNQAAKFYTIVDGLVHRRTNGAVILITKSFQSDEELAGAWNVEVDFATKIAPVLRHYLPGTI